MFDSLDEAGLVATIEEATREEAAAGARRLAAVGELVSRRVGAADDESWALWVCDEWDSVAAEVAAAMNVSHGKASGQMRIAETLRDRLPMVAGLFAQGRLSVRVVSAITWRTRLITDDAVWAMVDAVLVKRAEKWGPLPDKNLTAAVDALVFGFDPDALIVSKEEARTRDFVVGHYVVGHYEDEAGVTSVWGKLLAGDAAALKKKVAAIAATVCHEDPRNAGERRADAAGAWANGNDYLVCMCGSPTCPVAGQPAPKSSVVINVYADQTAIAAAQSAPSAPDCVGTAILSGTDVMPTPLLAGLLRNGAKLRPVGKPDLEPEPAYRPSARLARFVRARDLTCRFPGCTMAAEYCDIDHVIPYPLGPTHPSNLACLCRKHHHLKTFWTGNWELELLPDGAALWTSPTGRTYTTYPGCRSFFPQWDTDTGVWPPPPQPETFSTDRAVMIPHRKRTREQDRVARVKAEREHNISQRRSDPDPPNDPDPPAS